MKRRDVISEMCARSCGVSTINSSAVAMIYSSMYTGYAHVQAFRYLFASYYSAMAYVHTMCYALYVLLQYNAPDCYVFYR
jgi:hypothetical protein